MRLPKFLAIFGQKVKVEKAVLEPGIGGLSYSKGLIQISSQLKSSEIDQVLIHELVHSVFYRLSIYQNVSLDTEEMIAEGISKAITENFVLKVKKV
jgi:uncharacterized protein YjaZ